MQGSRGKRYIVVWCSRITPMAELNDRELQRPAVVYGRTETPVQCPCKYSYFRCVKVPYYQHIIRAFHCEVKFCREFINAKQHSWPGTEGKGQFPRQWAQVGWRWVKSWFANCCLNRHQLAPRISDHCRHTYEWILANCSIEICVLDFKPFTYYGTGSACGSCCR